MPIYKKCVKFLNKTVNSSGCASAIELPDNQTFGNGHSNNITEEMARYHLNDIFQPIISRICEERGRIKKQGR